MKLILAAVIVAAFASPLLALQIERKSDDSQAADKHSSAEQGGASQQPIVVNVLPPKKTDEEASEDRREREEKKEIDRQLAEFTRGLFYATVILAVATIGLLIATVGLGYFAFRQARDMKVSVDASRRSADAATKAANANVAALEVNRAQIRARLHIPETPSSTITVGQSWYSFVKLHIANLGQSPARSIQLEVTAQITPPPGQTNPLFPSQTQIVFVGTLGGGDNTERRFEFEKLPPDLAANATRNGVVIFVEVKIGFIDIFDETRSEEIELAVWCPPRATFPEPIKLRPPGPLSRKRQQ